MDLSEDFGSDAAAGVEGVWAPVGIDAEVKVARIGNSEAQRAYRRIPRAVRRRLEDGFLNDKDSTKWISEFLADNILKDWKGLADDGKAIKYSRDNAIKMLTKYRRFLDRVWELAKDEDLFNIAEVKSDAKN